MKIVHRCTRTRLIPAAVLLVLSFSIGILQAQTCYTITTVDIPGLSDADVFLSKINDAGQTVGYYQGADTVAHAFLRNPDGTMIYFDVPGRSVTAALGINMAGQITGLAGFAGSVQGFVRQPDGTMSFFEVPGSASGATHAHDIAQDGRVTGLWLDNYGHNHGFIRSADGTEYTLFDVPGAAETYPLGISDSVQVGYYKITSVYDWYIYGFIRNADASYTTIQLPGVCHFMPNAANNVGQVAGGWGCDSVHGFVRGPDGEIETFDVPGAVETEIFGINNVGVLSGRYRAAEGRHHGFIATPCQALNEPPDITDLSSSRDPFRVGSTVAVSASFTDPNTADTHTAVWDWGDGTTTPGAIGESAGSGTITGEHIYSAPGVYVLTLVVTDSRAASGQAKFEYIVVFDPNGGFVTGGGSIISPAGAYVPDPSLTDRATFGFVSKYLKGATAPSGNTQFRFGVANLDFKSTQYQWLVAAGAKAQYKGEGTINGGGRFGFLLTATDGDAKGQDGSDGFRIKIWDTETGAIIYDNQIGNGDDSGATTLLDEGSIVIHK